MNLAKKVIESDYCLYIIYQEEDENDYWILEITKDTWEHYFKGDREYTTENADIYLNDDNNTNVGYCWGAFDSLEDAEAEI